jgi:hypothetical protein
MPIRQFETIPGWVSWENQGANVAVADLSGNGKPDLLVLRVDAPAGGPNAAFYRVGSSLDSQGQVRTWGPWIPVPDWDSMRDEGAGLAVANFGTAGLALVVLQVRSNGGTEPNNGRFKLGQQLDPQGVVQGAWSAWQDIPEWGSFRDQGAAVTAADLDGDGVPELVIFHIDDFHSDHQAPGLPNKGKYRVGRQLGINGTVASWGEWKTVDWESFFNQGAGIAVADLTGSGQHDLVVFQVDNPIGENAGKYRVGWDIDAQGQLHEGWSPWVTIEGWDSWEDAGGGIALAHFQGDQRPKAVIFHVDNPPGPNAGRFRVTDLLLDIDQAPSVGLWRLLPYFSEVLPVHAAVMHTGSVLFFAGSGNNVFRRTSPDFGNETRAVYTSVIWNPADNTFEHPPTLRRPDGSVVDYFCCGHCRLPDGRLLIAGGSDQYDKIIVDGQMQPAGHGFTGLNDAMTFDPASRQWQLIEPMQHKRWYPTLLTLHNGDVIAASGLDGNSQATGQLEILSAPYDGGWTPGREFNLPLYPHLFETSDGKLVYTGGKMDTPGPSNPLTFAALTPTAATLIDNLDDADKCNQSASVILPPAQLQRFMILGGGPEDEDGQPRQPATQRVSVVDLMNPAPSYGRRANLNRERMHVNAVLLPDQTVLATGGGVFREATPEGKPDPTQFNEVLEAEIYDPTADSWTLTAPATVARLYHSVALLLPDGRVITAGGNPDKGQNVTWLPAEDPMEEMRLEMFSPPYLFRSTEADPRPVITESPTDIAYNDTFNVELAKPAPDASACLIRPGLTTHSFNVEQRLIALNTTQPTPSTLSTQVDVDNLVAPPGWYMLFVLDRLKVPSVARWVHLA